MHHFADPSRAVQRDRISSELRSSRAKCTLNRRISGVQDGKMYADFCFDCACSGRKASSGRYQQADQQNGENGEVLHF